MAKSIMVQGTTSNAGKSFLAAALCRIFQQDGHSVAPFKSQNMALNSFITADGLEMGRAQVMQAEAAGIAPTVEMNPILLKPTNDTGSQVIVNGEVRGVMSARDYFAFKKNLVPDVMRAYNALADSGKYLKIYNCIARQPLTAEEFVPEMLGDELRALNASLGIPGSLSELGVTPDKFGAMADDAMKSSNIAVNPRTTTRKDVLALYQEAL